MDDLSDMTKAELEAKAEEMGLSVSGTKADLVAAIEAAQAGAGSESSGEGPVCVNCGEPATVQTTNPSAGVVYYCDRHAQLSGESVTPIGRD